MEGRKRLTDSLVIRKTAPASRILALGGDFAWLVVWTVLIVVAQAWHWPRPTPKRGVELADLILWAVQLASVSPTLFLLHRSISQVRRGGERRGGVNSWRVGVSEWKVGWK